MDNGLELNDFIDDYLLRERGPNSLRSEVVSVTAVGTLADERLADVPMLNELEKRGLRVEKLGAFSDLQSLAESKVWSLAFVLSPHKAAAVKLCATVSPKVRMVGAVDTLIREGREITGFNVNSFAIDRALQQLTSAPTPTHVLILGSGPVAACALVGVSAILPNAKVGILARSRQHAMNLASRLGIGIPVENGTDFNPTLVVHGTTVGERDDADTFQFDLGNVFRPGVRLLDANSRLSPLQQSALKAGCLVLGGTYIQYLSNQLRIALMSQ